MSDLLARKRAYQSGVFKSQERYQEVIGGKEVRRGKEMPLSLNDVSWSDVNLYTEL
jgi:hypothetical protein